MYDEMDGARVQGYAEWCCATKGMQENFRLTGRK